MDLMQPRLFAASKAAAERLVKICFGPQVAFEGTPCVFKTEELHEVDRDGWLIGMIVADTASLSVFVHRMGSGHNKPISLKQAQLSITMDNAVDILRRAHIMNKEESILHNYLTYFTTVADVGFAVLLTTPALARRLAVVGFKVQAQLTFGDAPTFGPSLDPVLDAPWSDVMELPEAKKAWGDTSRDNFSWHFRFSWSEEG